MKTQLTRCPVCEHDLTVTRLACDNCATTIEGSFSSISGPFNSLSPEQAAFALTFIKCEGRFNRMEDELKISYPTLRNRLVELLRALGFEPAREDPQPNRLSNEERERILDDMSEGRITYEDARKLLAGEN
jgi:hypothetical protein